MGEDQPEELPQLMGIEEQAAGDADVQAVLEQDVGRADAEEGADRANARNETWMLLINTLVENSAAGADE